MPMKTDKAIVKKINGGGVEASAGGFKVVLDTADEGERQGMTPVELMLCSLGACQALTTSILADHHRISIEDIRVEIEGDMDSNGFSGTDPNVRSGFQKIRQHFHIKSNESEERIKLLMEMVEKKCPVSDSINNGVEFGKSVYTLNS
ncbi:OsmC family protein [Oceanobacillus neutriphilus]|uniref:Peroxiredoxin n=1 Tax=Oceanobacillus neutriphilus TaxID=531815 RepID=A0ABQ2P1B8_9BACI|nr:OsmC family protein [Oceanobacillus neutriphilus]GGP15824.1 peroxiredoxin [Oceanobacillus neutriphilus]